MIDIYHERTKHLVDGQYICHFCSQPCPQCSAENMSSDLWHCPSCNVSYDVHSDDMLHRIIFQRKLNHKCFQLEIDYEENKIKVFQCNNQLIPVLPEIQIETISNINPTNVTDKLKTLLVFS